MVTAARLSAQPKPVPLYYIVLLSKNMVVGMVNPHFPTATKIRSSTRQQPSVASAFAFFSTFVCKTSERSDLFQDSLMRVNLNKDVPTLWRVSGLPNPIKPKHMTMVGWGRFSLYSLLNADNRSNIHFDLSPSLPPLTSSLPRDVSTMNLSCPDRTEPEYIISLRVLLWPWLRSRAGY